MKYRISLAAQSDLDDCWLYIARDNPDAADRFLDQLIDKLAMLAEHPAAGRNCRALRPGLYRFPVGSYVLFYQIRAKHIEVVRVLHGARDIKAILEA